VLTEAQQRALERVGATVYREGATMPPVDLVHRPAQVFRPRDLPWLLEAQAPLVITFQDLIAYRAWSAFARFEDHQDYRLASHLALRSTQAVIAISGHNRGEVLREFDLPEEHVQVVHHGVDAERFAHRDPDANRRLLAGLGVEGAFFFSVGSDYAHKNLRLTLAAYSTFRGRWPGPNRPPSLVMVGHPSGTADGVFPSLRAHPPAGVVYLGDVSDDALAALYQESVALLYLSAYEGFGLPLLEAMAARTPALCTPLSSIPEVAGDAALYADDPTDLGIARQMTALATQAELRRTLAERGAARVGAFTWAETARKTFAVYQRALRAPSGRSLHERRAAATIAARLFR
jgi:glycosyltransferase involved in cell wall biosynthesis